MLTISGKPYSLCNGVTRRDVLRIGALGMGGLSLPSLLRAEQQAGIRGSHKAIIMVYMAGAPSHQDMYDLKMNAPSEIRGEFRPISTTVPGIEICEHLPGLARVMKQCVVLRSVYGSPSGDHDSFICYTGHSARNQPAGGWPSIGSVVSKLQGPVNPSVPPFFGLAPNAGHPPYGSPGHPGFLGVAHAAFRLSGPLATTWCSTAFPWSGSPAAGICSRGSIDSAVTWMRVEPSRAWTISPVRLLKC